MLDLGESTHHVVPESPCNCRVECLLEDSPDFFFLGGFQLISTARSVEVYVTKKGSQQEDLLMTCRYVTLIVVRTFVSA